MSMSHSISTSSTISTTPANIPASSSCLEFFQLIEPEPVFPPQYECISLPSKPRATWPSELEGQETLPSYTPTVYKMLSLQRKLEWITPYELSPNRQWKHVILELNSTQLNVYGNDRQLAPIYANSGAINLTKPDQFKSRLTNDFDLRQRCFYKERGLLSKDNLVRSYSLQYGRIGIALDYKKRKNVVRLRLETEQFLLEFPTTQSMIEWYCCIGLGIDNALDLNRREMPKYWIY
ncbi:unnamed protein product [Ambrosiozyma monospora]|uniref:Unnamed protein product n=1 Tax=Ambrosiozyma monospora TaxID=43982 RepID=A0ACB5UCI4_AMBMO|nr:unnamed protein product [Ambrosiozyma monospora]